MDSSHLFTIHIFVSSFAYLKVHLFVIFVSPLHVWKSLFVIGLSTWEGVKEHDINIEPKFYR